MPDCIKSNLYNLLKMDNPDMDVSEFNELFDKVDICLDFEEISKEDPESIFNDVEFIKEFTKCNGYKINRQSQNTHMEDLDFFIQDLKDSNHAIIKLMHIGKPAVLPLINALQNEDRVFRKNIIITLGNIKDSRAVNPIIKHLKDKKPSVRKSAAEALGKIKDNRAVDPLIQTLTDRYKIVRISAIEALGELNDPRTVEPLIKTLKDDYWEVRKRVVETLGKLKDIRAVEPLFLTLRDRNWEVSKSAVEALGELKDLRAVEPLIQILNDEINIEVRISAINTLVELTSSNS